MDKNKETLQELKNDVYKLNMLVKLYSMYDKKDIAEIISKIMSAYEGIKYSYKFIYDTDNNEKCVISPVEYHKYSLKLTLPHTESNNNWYSYKYNIDDMFFLPPSIYNTENKININYIQEFIDFVFQKRMDNKVEIIDKQTISKYSDEFIENTKVAQFLRQNNRKHYISEKDAEKARNNFEKNCTVSRKAMFKCIVSILNDYEDNSVKAQSIIREEAYPNEDNNTTTFMLYDTLYIYRIIKDFKFEVYVTEDTVSNYDLELKNIDYNMDTDINFFELKNTIQTIFWDCVNLKKFMNGIEEKLIENHHLNEQDIFDVYLAVKNKAKKYSL